MTGSNGRRRARRPRSREARQTAFIAAAALVWGAALATQYVASQLGARHNLGSWLYRVPPTSRFTVELALVATSDAAVIALLIRGWRWTCIPLALLWASIYATLVDVIYAPTAVWRWYATYNALPADRAVFRLAWIIVAATVVLVTSAEHRVRRAVARSVTALHRSTRPTASTWPRRSVLPGGYPRGSYALGPSAIRAILAAFRRPAPSRPESQTPLDGAAP